MKGHNRRENHVHEEVILGLVHPGDIGQRPANQAEDRIHLGDDRSGVVSGGHRLGEGRGGLHGKGRAAVGRGEVAEGVVVGGQGAPVRIGHAGDPVGGFVEPLVGELGWQGVRRGAAHLEHGGQILFQPAAAHVCHRCQGIGGDVIAELLDPALRPIEQLGLVEVGDFPGAGGRIGERRLIEVGGQAGQHVAVGTLHHRGIGPMAAEQGALLGEGGVLAGIAVEVDAGFHRFIGHMPSVGTLHLAALGNGHQAGGHLGRVARTRAQRPRADKLDGLSAPRAGDEVPRLRAGGIGAGDQPSPEAGGLLGGVVGRPTRVEIRP